MGIPLNEEFNLALVVNGHEVRITDLPRSAQLIARLAEETGWIVKAGYSMYYEYPKVYKTGDREGEEHGEQWVDNYWLEGVNPDRGKRFTATWKTYDCRVTKFDHATWGVYDLINSTMLKKLIKGEIDEVEKKAYVPKVEREKAYE